ncbi:MAG: glycosyltransferase [Prevotella sp.]|nr:glycosyltransferase [Prevotella sp.]
MITVITCTYNAEAVLQRTLDSVARQDYVAVQHIIMDGKSADGTLNIARQYADAENTHEVTVVSEPDGGLYDAMNKAIRLTKGKYLVFLNAGDTFYDEHTLTTVAKSDVNGNCGVIYGNTEIVDADGHSLGMRRLQPPENLTWRSFANGMLVCHQAFYANTEITKTVAYDLRYHLSADVDWCIRVMREAERRGLPIVNTHATLCRYLDGGLTVKNHRASLIERFRIMRKHYGLMTTIYKHLTFLFRQ